MVPGTKGTGQLSVPVVPGTFVRTGSPNQNFFRIPECFKGFYNGHYSEGEGQLTFAPFQITDRIYLINYKLRSSISKKGL